jgi:hypothetical protein
VWVGGMVWAIARGLLSSASINEKQFIRIAWNARVLLPYFFSSTKTTLLKLADAFTTAR